MPRVHWSCIAVVLAGCSAPSEPPAVPVVPPVPEAPATGSAPQASTEASVSEPAGPITLQQALALALVGSPGLATYSWELRASEARELQAGLRPNPVFGVSVENVLGTGDFKRGGEAQTTLQLSQAIELGGKRNARREAAAVGRVLAGKGYEARRIEILAETTEHFIHLVANQHRLKLAKEQVALSESALEAAKRRTESGKASDLEGRGRIAAGG